ncbi:hypothetical protein EJ06DRAFT_554078 [Trichodelitschia bisporula]|uniref:Uncharacterized protein n=1 Tax=Trichodelitschia bisporula TaxID=703511 RepID=A0A6G1I791_9PEZI|nr:hypothetical protein EJ06DRAFT_554078 [Trichodelitschia bisporula]
MSSNSPSSFEGFPPEPDQRPVKQLPYQLRHNIAVFFEEHQYLEGFAFLREITSSGTSSTNSAGPLTGFKPLPQHLACAATIALHPQFSTRAKTEEDRQAAFEALRFLDAVLRVVGPIGADFGEAFMFQDANHRRHLKRRATSDEEYDSDRLNTPFAHEKSLFNQVEDFWSVVGWAFNCSVAHKGRWAVWQPWLAFMVDLLDEDLRSRVLFFAATGEVQVVQKSLLAIYVNKQGWTGRRNIMNAILADGTQTSLNMFGEVWKDETKGRKETKVEPAKKLDIMDDKWGDYAAAEYEKDDVEDEPTEDDKDTELEVDMSCSVQRLGGQDSVELREHFIRLLFALCANAPPGEFMALDQLCDLCTESLPKLPIGTYSSFLARLELPPHAEAALLLNIIFSFLPNRPANVDLFSITQPILVARYFPYPANSSETIDQAKMSLATEALLLNLINQKMLDPDEKLISSIKKGVDKRREKAKRDTRRRDKSKVAEQAAAKLQLELSAERIQTIIESGTADDFPHEPSSELSSLGNSSGDETIIDW